MKKLIAILMILVIVSCKKDEVNPNLIREFSIKSTNANALFSIKVALPENNNSTQKYATLYLLDGEENFSFVTKNVNQISNEHSKSNVLVVSIGYGNDRAKDYTPSKADEGEGGAENFMHFIKEELIPRIESDFSVDTSRDGRTILGHSFGGLLAAYAFTNFNSVFGNYLMLSPSIWYDNEILLRLEQDHRSTNQNKQQVVFMGLGELEMSGRMLAPYMAFYRRLLVNYPGIKIKNHIEPHLNHVGSKNPNIQEALKFYFQTR